MRQTKIVCTIGPASESPEIVKELIMAGMNVARLNFSHGTHEDHRLRIYTVRRVARELGVPISILLDTKGPEIRTGQLSRPVQLVEGQKFTLTSKDIVGNVHQVSITYPGLCQEVTPGTTILISDGLISLMVIETNPEEITCTVTFGGLLKSQQGVNIPGVAVNLPALTEKDIADINLGIRLDVDFIAVSFVRKAADVIAIRKILEQKKVQIDIIAKIENYKGVKNFDSILIVADGIMVARGDLGVEIPAEEVPLVQKMVIEKCNRVGKPVITATQMLESMTQYPRPTRAEASDVANAVLDGSDALMLSGETAAGKFSVEAVRTMARIIERTEQAFYLQRKSAFPPYEMPQNTTDAISYATSVTASALAAAAIITSTESGSTARMVAKYRPQVPIIAATSNTGVQRRLSLVRGIYPIKINNTEGTDAMIYEAINAALQTEQVKCGDLVVVTAGVPAGVPGTTNLLKVHVVGEILAKGQGIGTGSKTGKVRLVRTAEEAIQKIESKEDILVTYSTDREFIQAMKKAGAVITEEGGLTSHAAIVGLNLHVPTVVGLKNVFSILEDGCIITIDADRGVIYKGISRVL